MVFQTQYRLYKWVVMYIDLRNPPARFIQIINNWFIEILDGRVVVFLDDIFIFSSITEEYYKLIKKVFTQVFNCKLKSGVFFRIPLPSLYLTSLQKACTLVI